MKAPGRIRLVSYSTIASFRLAVSIALAVAISFVFASCDIINNPIGRIVPPESITISPATIVDMAPGEWRQLTATVGPAGASQAVIWSITANVGIIQYGGLLLDLRHTLPPTITITARVANHPAILDMATITVLEPIRITVPNIPYQGQVDIELRDTEGNRVFTGEETNVQSGTATFNLFWDSIGVAFVDTGTYEVILFVSDQGNQRVYQSSQTISRGTNNIAFGDFDEMPPVTITVTGIPDGHDVTWATLRIAEAGNYVISMWWPEINGSTATLTVRGVPPGTYDVILYSFVSDSEMIHIGRSKNIVAGANQIPFAEFEVLQPITITVTGIPLALQRSWFGDIALYTPGTNNEVGLGWTDTVGASTTVQVWFYAAAGPHDVVLWFVGNLGTFGFIAPGRNITAGNNTIPFSAFTPR